MAEADLQQTHKRRRVLEPFMFETYPRLLEMPAFRHG